MPIRIKAWRCGEHLLQAFLRKPEQRATFFDNPTRFRPTPPQGVSRDRPLSSRCTND
jgi:hypothetical protein